MCNLFYFILFFFSCKCNLVIIRLPQTLATFQLNILQHIAWCCDMCWNGLAKRPQNFKRNMWMFMTPRPLPRNKWTYSSHALVPKNVRRRCVGMLQAFGQAFMLQSNQKWCVCWKTNEKTKTKNRIAGRWSWRSLKWSSWVTSSARMDLNARSW